MFIRKSRLERWQIAWEEEPTEEYTSMEDESPEVDFLGNKVESHEDESSMSSSQLPTYHLSGVGFGGGTPKHK